VRLQAGGLMAAGVLALVACSREDCGAEAGLGCSVAVG
jgi:hypothetical protein